MDSFSSFSASPGPFSQCKLSPFIIPYSKSSSSSSGSSNSSENLAAEKQQVLTCGQVVLLGLEVRPPDDWSGTVADFCKLFEKFLHCISFTHHFQLRETVVQSQACNPRTTVMPDGLFWYDLAAINRIVMQTQPYGFKIFTTTKIDVRNSHISKELVLSISLSAVYETKASNPSIKSKASLHTAKIDVEEWGVRQLMERQRFSPPKPPTREAKMNVNIVSPVAIMCRSYEMGRLSTLITIAIENRHFQHAINVKEIVLRIGMTSIEPDRASSEGEFDSGNDDNDTNSDYCEYSKRDAILARLMGYLQLTPVASSNGDVFPVTISSLGSYSFAYEATFSSSSDDMCAHRAALHGLTRGGMLSTPCTIWWSQEGEPVSDFHSEHDVKWSLGSTYQPSRNTGTSIKTLRDLQVDIQGNGSTYKVDVPLTLLISIKNKSDSVLRRSVVQVAAAADPSYRNLAFKSFLVLENGVMGHDLHPQSNNTIIVRITVLPLVCGPLVIDGLLLDGVETGEQALIAYAYRAHVNS